MQELELNAGPDIKALRPSPLRCDGLSLGENRFWEGPREEAGAVVLFSKEGTRELVESF